MKVGILTFHYAHNYGAVLQAFALKKWLSMHGVQAEIINYENKRIKDNYNKKLHQKVGVKDFLNFEQVVRKVKFNLKASKIQDVWEEQWYSFNSFINSELVSESTTDAWKNYYDILIVGSDQVWTSWLTGGLDQNYFLDFETTSKKVSYAASVFEGRVKTDEIEYFKRCIGNFDFVSVREESLCTSLKKECGIDSITVVDPTLLLGSDDYKELLVNKCLCNDKYILAYFVTEDNVLRDELRTYAEKKNMRLLEIHYYGEVKSNPDYIANAGPKEFLWYVFNAEMVFTNSFHGTVFSILFKKEFYCVYSKDVRKENLLSRLGLKSRHIEKVADIRQDNRIDYAKADLMLHSYRADSEKYLLDVLRSCCHD